MMVLVMGVLSHGQAQAANEGQEDLDKATAAKLNANTLSDLGQVIKLLESALEKGLDPANIQFAKELLASTRVQRGTAIAQAIFNTLPPEPNWRDFRRLALEDLEKAVSMDPNQPQALLSIAQLNLLPGGDSQRATAALSDAIRLADSDPPLKVKGLLLRAGLTEDAAKKKADLDEAVRVAPGSSVGLRARGAWYFDQKQYPEALADFNASLKLDPQSAAVLNARGTTLVELKRYDEALADFTKAHELEPKAVSPLYQKGRALGLQGKFKEARDVLDQAYLIDPTHLGVLLLRSSVLQELKENDRALADVDRALKLRPGLAVAMQLRAALLAGSNKFAEAIDQLEALQRATPEDSDVDLQLAMFYNVEQRPRKAIELFSKVLTKDPKSFIALRGRADAYLSVGKQAEAIADYEQALEVQPENSGVLNNLAWVLATSPDDKLRNGKRSIELATKACKVTEYKQAHILSTLAAGYAETGDFKTAIEWSQKAVDLGKDDQKEALAKELAGYKEGKPVRELQNIAEKEGPKLPALPPIDKPTEKPVEKPQEPSLLPTPTPESAKPLESPQPAPDASKSNEAPQPKPEWPRLDEPPLDSQAPEKPKS
jgi:tetratricopeptide (TPR) repeat protein